MTTARNRAYVRDILAGLIPTDGLFGPIYAVVETFGGPDLGMRTAAEIDDMAAEIRRIRSTPLSPAGLQNMRPAVPATAPKSRWG